MRLIILPAFFWGFLVVIMLFALDPILVFGHTAQ